MYKIALVPGDGIGREVIPETARVLDNLGLSFEFNTVEVGYDVFKTHGISVPDNAVEAILKNDACLFGATTTPVGVKNYKSAIVTLRRALDLYANVRPVKSYSFPGIQDGIDLVVVRENTEGFYSGIEYGNEDTAFTVRVITRRATEKIAHYAFKLAMKRKRKVTIVTKANIMRKTCGLFLDVCLEVANKYPDIEVNHLFIDVAAMNMVMKPKVYDVIVTANLFGDVLSDLSAGLVGGLGLAPSSNIGDNFGLFEPVHGSAPDIAGKGLANPIAAFLSAKLMLDYLGEESLAHHLEKAIRSVIVEEKVLTPDLGGTASTKNVTDAVIRFLQND